ncbi:hypothetical protein Tco_0445795 [Tanacetum coccineum]
MTGRSWYRDLIWMHFILDPYQTERYRVIIKEMVAGYGQSLPRHRCPGGCEIRWYLRLFIRSSVLIIGKSNSTFQCTKDSKESPSFRYLFWKTMSLMRTEWGFIVVKLHEQWFDLVMLSRKALAITNCQIPNSPMIEFTPFCLRVNLCVSNLEGNSILLNQLLDGKVFWRDNPATQFCKSLWGIVTKSNVDHAELIWEEFLLRDKDIFSHTKQAQSHVMKTQKEQYLLSSSLYGTVFPISDTWLLRIQKKKTPQEGARVQPVNKACATPKKPTTTHTSQQTKPQSSSGNKETFHAYDDPDLELAKKLSLETPQEKGEGEVGKGKAVVSEEQVAHSLIDLSKKKRTTDQFILVRRDQTPPDSTTGPSSQPPSLTGLLPPINTEATTLTTSLPEITPFIALQLRIPVLRLFDNYLGNKIVDALLMVSERHTTKVKKTTRESMIVIDDEDDDDDSNRPSAGSYQGRSTKRRRICSAATGTNRKEEALAKALIWKDQLSTSVKALSQETMSYHTLNGGWFRRKEFYINKHSESSDREAVRRDANSHFTRSQKRILKIFIQTILKICSFSIFKKSSTICLDRHRTGLHPSSQHSGRRNLSDQESCGRDYSLEIERLPKQDQPSERPNWDASDYYFKMTIRSSLKPEQLSSETNTDQRKTESGLWMTREEAKTSSLQIEKRIQEQNDILEGSFKDGDGDGDTQFQ